MSTDLAPPPAKRQKRTHDEKVLAIKELMKEVRGARCTVCHDFLGYYPTSDDHPYFLPVIMCKDCMKDDYFRLVPRTMRRLASEMRTTRDLCHDPKNDGVLSSSEEEEEDEE